MAEKIAIAAHVTGQSKLVELDVFEGEDYPHAGECGNGGVGHHERTTIFSDQELSLNGPLTLDDAKSRNRLLIGRVPVEPGGG